MGDRLTENTYILPRVIFGNRGDLASRWALLHSLKSFGLDDIHVYRDQPGDLPDLGYPTYSYGRLRNLFPDHEGSNLLKSASHVLWAVGLDLQDDSSLAKLIYLNLLFNRYRRAGLTIWCLFQGAGPLTTTMGRWLTRRLLKRVDCFIARDPGSFELVRSLSDPGHTKLAHDAIFLPGLDAEAKPDPDVDALFETEQPVIGLNIRQWYHFSSSLIPYQFARRRYYERCLAGMANLEEKVLELVRQLRTQHDARILLISAYQPGVVDWEDDLFWLKRLLNASGDPDVMLVDWPLSLPAYFRLMSRLDVMVGMRLHSTLIALRYGVPGINLSYTLKGRDIMRHLDLEDWVVDLDDFVSGSADVLSHVASILKDMDRQRERTRDAVQRAIEVNSKVLSELFMGRAG